MMGQGLYRKNTMASPPALPRREGAGMRKGRLKELGECFWGISNIFYKEINSRSLPAFPL